MRMTGMLIGALAVSAAAALSARPAQSAGTVTPVLGHWETGVDAGVPIVIADARKWDGKPPASPDDLGRRLFGVVRPEFTVNVTSSGAFPLAVIDTPKDFRTGSLMVQFKLIGGESDQIAGLVFNLKPTGDYLYVRYNTRDDNVALWRFSKGQREVIAHGEAHRRLAMNTWHPLSVTLKGRRLSAEAAGDLRVDHELTEEVSGRTGVWTKRDSVTAFRNWSTR